MPIAALPAAIIAASAISGGAALAGGAISASGAKSAAEAQMTAAQRAAALGQQAGQTGQAGVDTALATQNQNLSPYLATGQTGLGMLNAAVAPGGSLAGQFNFDPSQLADNPAYKFQLQQGLLALDRSAAARGVSTSGGTAKDIQDYAQSLAGTSYNNVFNQELTRYGTNRNTNLGNIQALLGQGNTGTQLFDQAQQWAAQTKGNFGLAGAGMQTAALEGGANAAAAGDVGSANAWNSALGGISNAAQFLSMADLLKNAQNPTAPTPAPTSSAAPALSPYSSTVYPWQLGGAGMAPSSPSTLATNSGTSAAGLLPPAAAPAPTMAGPYNPPAYLPPVNYNQQGYSMAGGL